MTFRNLPVIPPWVYGVLLLFVATGPAAAQTEYTWTGAGGDTNWSNANNWTPTGGPPGDLGLTGNTEVALFDSAGTTATASNIDSGYSLGAIATTAGASGGLMTATFSGNGTLRVNGGYSIGSFSNVVAAAQGRDLDVRLVNIPNVQFGTPDVTSTFYVDAGRVLTSNVQQVTNLGGNVNKEGAGTLIWQGGVVNHTDLGTRALNINGGTFASHQSINNVTQINVASGAALQAGLMAGGVLSPSGADIVFADNAALKVVTDGTAISQLQNVDVIKGANDTFRIVLTGLDPTGTETYTPTGLFLQAQSLTGFDPNGTYIPSDPGDFAVSGEGFIVTDWSLEVVNNNQIRFISITVTPVPEPTTVLAVAAAGGLLLVRGRRLLRRHPL